MATLRRIIRIACIGDSLTEGYSRRGSQWFPYPDMLPDLLAPVPVETHNFGISGELTQQILLRCARSIFHERPDALRFDAAFILAGTNDLGYGLALSDILSNLTKIAQIARSKGAKVFFVGIPPLGSSIAMPGHTKEQKTLNAMIKDMCETNKFVFLDLYPVMAVPDDGVLIPEYCDSDGLHFTKKGYEKLATVVAAATREWLAQDFGETFE